MAFAFKVNDTVRIKAPFAGAGKEGIVRIVDDRMLGRPPKVQGGILVAFEAERTSAWHAADELILVDRPGG
jgi:hypothetical protein